MSDSRPIGIIGGGRVGQAFGRLLASHHDILIASPNHADSAAKFIGAAARAVSRRQIANNCQRVLIAVPDGAVAEVAANLGSGSLEAALHTCGSLGPSALAPLASRGVSCGTFHPLQTFATPLTGVEVLPGSSFGICASGSALDWAQQLAQQLDGDPLVIAEENLSLYHAAASLAGNASIAVIDAAVMLMEPAGLRRDQALKAIAPLVRAGTENALALGPIAALTGPIERGDIGTIRRHLASLQMQSESAQALYQGTARHLLAMAREKGLSHEQAAALDELLGATEKE